MDAKLEALDAAMNRQWVMLQHVTNYMRALGIGETFIVPQVIILPPDEDGWGEFKFKYRVIEGGVSEDYEWYCLKCNEVVDPQSVSFEEQHVGCGCPVVALLTSSITALQAVIENPELVLVAVDPKIIDAEMLEWLRHGSTPDSTLDLEVEDNTKGSAE